MPVTSWTRAGGGGGATGAFTKKGGGTLTLTAANSYGGGTTVEGGTLVAAHGDALGTGALTIVSGATARAKAVCPKHFRSPACPPPARGSWT